jgi:hypothetical protein
MSLIAQLRDKLSLAERNDAQGVVSRFKTVTEFLSEAVDAAKDSDAIQGVINAIPWESVSIVGKGVVHALPPLKFVYSLTEKLTEITDPDELGFLACTVAYERSVEQSFRSLGLTSHKPIDAPALRNRLPTEADTLTDFGTFSYTSALTHPFVVDAAAALRSFALACHFDDDQTRLLLVEVQTRFVPNLKNVLATTDRFKNFRERMELGTAETRAQHSLQLHAAYQVWQFEDRPVFGNEQFTLSEIYVNIECGALRWGDVRNSSLRNAGSPRENRPLDPFVEKNGDRHSLMDQCYRTWQIQAYATLS